METILLYIYARSICKLFSGLNTEVVENEEENNNNIRSFLLLVLLIGSGPICQLSYAPLSKK